MYSFFQSQHLGGIMKKKSSHDLKYLLDKQYKATLTLVRLVASLSVDVTRLTTKVEEQEALIKRLSAGDTLEEETV